MKTSFSICPIFIPHFGCPQQCVFCNQHKITNHSDKPSPEEVRDIVLEWRAHSHSKAIELAFYGGSFTALPVPEQEAYLEVAQALKQEELISGIRLSTRPDALGDEVVQRLLHYGVETVEIGFQSLDEEVLTESRRGHHVQSGIEAARRLRRAGIQIGGQMMVGLPQDNPEKSIQTAKDLVALGVDFVRIYPTVVIADTALADAWREGAFIPWEEEKVIATCATCVEIFQGAKIPIIRLGLQDEESLRNGGIVAGFHHPAMGELVYSRLFRNKIEALIGDEEILTIVVNPKDISKAVGYKGQNKAYFKEKYQVELQVMGDEGIPQGYCQREENYCI